MKKSYWLFLIPAALIAVGLLLIALNACQFTLSRAGLNVRGLPHRPITSLTNWGQGRAPTPGQCPMGTVEMDVENLFLECPRGTK